MSVLTIEELKVSYGDIHAVKGVSFDVREGEIFTLIGANGAGKTSTLRAISGLLRYRGRISLDGRELEEVAPDRGTDRPAATIAVPTDGRMPQRQRDPREVAPPTGPGQRRPRGVRTSGRATPRAADTTFSSQPRAVQSSCARKR